MLQHLAVACLNYPWLAKLCHKRGTRDAGMLALGGARHAVLARDIPADPESGGWAFYAVLRCLGSAQTKRTG